MPEVEPEVRTRHPVAVVEAPQHASVSLLRELWGGWDYVKLKTSKVYYGFGVPKGNGDPVVVVPGFLGNDWYLIELHLWLRRLGYVAYMSKIGHNAQCPDTLMHRLMKTVNRAYAETGRPVHVIGHSFGGVLARGVATREPERIASLTTLGSPFRGVRVNPIVMWSIMQVRHFSHKHRRRGKDCFTDACACGFLCTMRDPFPEDIMQTNIYSKGDGVVDWQSCLSGDPERDVRVKGTHIGLAWNPDVYETIANRLKESRDWNARRFSGQASLREKKTRRGKNRARKAGSASGGGKTKASAGAPDKKTAPKGSPANGNGRKKPEDTKRKNRSAA